MYLTRMKKIPLTEGEFAIVDDCDFAKLSVLKWMVQSGKRKKYARRSYTCGERKVDGKLKQRVAWMHRVVMDCPEGLVVDHINGNGLDNRRKNLRIVTPSQNGLNKVASSNNKSGYKGVYRTGKRYKTKWFALIYIPVKGKLPNKVYLGYFSRKSDAAKAYNEAAKMYHGEFAKLNVI